mgnify:CR=1 FL=1
MSTKNDSEKADEQIEGIAIIGMAGRFPGAISIESFWQNLRNGVESLSLFTDEELIAAGVPATLVNDSNYVKVGGVLDNRSNRRFRKQQRRINEIVEEKTAELEENIVKQNRKDEFEADKIAYLASVKAGFDKQGCLRAMSVLNRTTGVKFDQNHPTIEERVAALKAVMEKNKDENLVEEGKENLFQTQPLTYNLSPNQTSLRVNSRHGASIGDDIDRMFGS